MTLRQTIVRLHARAKRILSPLSPSASDGEVRGEIWRLGNRHRGWPLEGALDELKAPGLPNARAELLRACVRKLRSDQAASCA